MFMIDFDAESHYSVLGVAPTATAKEIGQAHDRLVRELRERQRREPENRQELEGREKAVNAVGDELKRPARRKQYDKANAHLRFYTVRVAAAPMFTDAADLVAVLHRAIGAQLARENVRLAPVSDLDRADFRADETPNALLDELLG